MSKSFVFNPFTSNFDEISEIALTNVGSTPNAQAASLDAGQNLTLQPADATNPGVLTSGTQTIGGNKTLSGVTTTSGTLNTNGGIDTSTPATLAIGTVNATTINIGNVGSTINLVGTVITETTSTLNVTNPVFTVNHGGAAGSASNSGMQVEEASSITGYVETSADRNSWILKAPNTAGIATITPGAGGITLNQSSHDPVTLTVVGSSPNANGASLSGQALTLQPADNTNPGIISTGTQNIPGSKNFLATAAFLNGANVSTGNLNVTSTIATNTIDTPSVSQTLTIGNSLAGNVALGRSGQTVTVNTLVTGPVRATSGVLSTGNTSLTTEVTGTLPIANGGTNSSSGLNNNRQMVSSGGAIIEAAAATNGQLLIGSTSAAPVIASLTAGTGISITNGAGSITITNTNPTPTGDIGQSSFAAAQTQTNATLTGLTFANATVRSFEAQVSVAISATSSLFESFNLRGIQRGSDWQMSTISVGDASGFSFSINSSGQVLYSSGTYTGFTAAAVRFRAQTLLV